MYIGLDIGGTKCAAVVGDLSDDCRVIKKEKFLTADLTPEAVLEKFSSFIETAIKEYKIDGIGISCGGPLDGRKGIIMCPPSLPLWDNIEIVKYFEEKFSIPTKLLNDANAGAVAEWKFGAGKGCDDLVFITCGTGFGAGVISGGRLLIGANDNFGEIGHVKLTNGGPIGYNKAGSVEGYCSGSGIKRLAKILYDKAKKKDCYIEKFGIENVDAKILADGAREESEFCKKVYAVSGRKLGEALSILIDLFNPSKIVIGGIFMRSGDLLIDEAEKVIKKQALPLSRKVCEIVPALLSENIGDVSALVVAKGEY